MSGRRERTEQHAGDQAGGQTGTSTRHKRHPLLFQQRFGEQNFWPAILLLALGAALLLWHPAKLDAYRRLLQLIVFVAGLTLVLTLVFRLRAYAQCWPDRLHLQLPLYHFDIPYTQITTVRPTELFRMFPPAQLRWSEQRFLDPLFHETVVVVELDELPRSAHWLRLWMSKFMLCPEKPGFVLAVRDWLAFRTELDEFRARQRRR
jgi:hypothetical protein